MAFQCGECGASISVGSVDFSKRVAACGACGAQTSLDTGEGTLRRVAASSVAGARAVPDGFHWKEVFAPGVANVVTTPSGSTVGMRKVVMIGFVVMVCLFSACMYSAPAATTVHVSDPGDGNVTVYSTSSTVEIGDPRVGKAMLLLFQAVAVLFIVQMFRGSKDRTELAITPVGLNVNHWTRGTLASYRALGKVVDARPVQLSQVIASTSTGTEVGVGIGGVTFSVGPKKVTNVYAWSVDATTDSGQVIRLPLTLDMRQAEYVAGRLVELTESVCRAAES